MRRDVLFLKRQCSGFNAILEDCDQTGVVDAMCTIIGLNTVPDGLYQMVMCNMHKDWETGHAETWQYMFTPWNPGQRESTDKH